MRGLAETLEEQQLASRSVIQSVDGMELAVAGFGFDHGGPLLDHAPREHGADSRLVLAELGISQTEFDALQDQGVVFSPS